MICVPLNLNLNLSLVIGVPVPRKHISILVCVSLLCFPGKGAHITRDMCFLGRRTDFSKKKKKVLYMSGDTIFYVS